MKKILEQYKSIWVFFKQNVLKIFLIMFGILLLSEIVSYLCFIFNKDMTMSFMQYVINSFGDELNKKGIELLLFFWMNNIRASFVAVLLGILPFLFLPVISLIINGASVGLVLGFSGIQGLSIILMFILGILPHGIFEITAFVLSVSLGVLLCLSLIRDKGEKGKLKYIIINIVKTFFMIVVPLILIAGIIEAYITPMLLELIK